MPLLIVQLASLSNEEHVMDDIAKVVEYKLHRNQAHIGKIMKTSPAQYALRAEKASKQLSISRAIFE